MTAADFKLDVYRDLAFPGLTYESHNRETELHLIGENLPPPSVIANMGDASLGTSPNPAREDHSHGHDLGTTFPTTGLYEGRVFGRTDQKRFYVYTGGSWWRYGYWGGTGRFLNVVARLAVQNVNNAADTDIIWDTIVTDSETAITVPVTNIPIPNERLSNTLAGLWAVNGYITWSAAPGGASNVRVIHSGGDIYEWSGNNGINSLNRGFSVPVLDMAAGNTFKVTVRQNSGAAINVTGKLYYTWVSP